MQIKIAAVVVLYNSDEQLSERLITYLPYVQKLYIIDNSESKVVLRLRINVQQSQKIEVFADQINRGIAEQLNFACTKAIAEGFDWLLTMDQDSAFYENSLQQYWQNIKDFAKLKEVSMFGISYLDENVESSQFIPYLEVKALITSGSVVNLNLFKVIGGFDENLFIDEVDLEYCFRSLVNGYKIVQFPNIFLIHQLGIKKQHRSIISLKWSSRTLHTPIRLYYMVRNFLYVRAKYKRIFPNEISQSERALINRIKNNFLYSKRRWKVFYYIFKGFIDFKRGRMGKLS